jgi:hypothetical protein
MKIEITALSSYEEKEEKFKEEVFRLTYVQIFFPSLLLKAPSAVSPIVSGNFWILYHANFTLSLLA